MPLPGKPSIWNRAALLVVFLLIGVILSQRYLAYSDPPKKSDIIVQFVGSEQEARRKEAWQLIQEGYSDYLFIPTLFSLYRVNQNRTDLSGIWITNIKPGIKLPQPPIGNAMSGEKFNKIRSEYRIPRFYEDTQAEIRLAKVTMDTCGFKSAIFVSSPYHMRRIKIITGRVFGPSYDIKFVPSRFESRLKAPLLLWQNMRHVFTEFTKMIWFLCYDLWDR